MGARIIPKGRSDMASLLQLSQDVMNIRKMVIIDDIRDTSIIVSTLPKIMLFCEIGASTSLL